MTGAPALAELAGWDVPLLRGAVGTLGLVAERLLPWRVRLDVVGRQLGRAECWSGPAGTAAAAALEELSTVTMGVGAALDGAHRSLAALVTDAAEAQQLAAAASSVAVAGGVPLDAAGQPRPDPRQPTAAMAPDHRADLADRQFAAARVAALAEEAQAAAARVLATAHAAQEPIGRLGDIAVPGVADFGELAARLAPVGPVGPVGPPQPPAGRAPGEVATWWAGLSVHQQRAAVATHPAEVGGLDGLPGWARDLANRRLLDRAVRDLPRGGAEHAMAVAVAAEIGRRQDDGQPVQLLQFDPLGDLVALSLGDVDTAAAIAVLIPGILTSPADDLAALTADARDVAAAASAAAPGLSVAAVAWLGYRTPRSVFAAPSSQLAQRGGPALDRALDGLAATRAAPGAPPTPRTTVLAHSYGALVAGRAAQATGRLAADALVLLGSPGTEALTARSLEAPEVYGAWTPADPVSVCDWFGPSPADPWFGDFELPTDLTQGHTQYYDADRPTLAAMGEVVAGTRKAR
ncbi:MAG: uncharacterized protein JWR70_2221 [Modestobacter sp.]|nr:uncharacterized protein [Modestobacter sp.]